MSSAASPAVSLEGVGKSFGAVQAVRDLSFDVGEGEFLALVGGSGSGKTTTLKLVNRLIEPDHGVVRIGGAPNTDAPAHELRRRIGYVFQGIGLFPHLTVAENVAVTPHLKKEPDADIERRVAELLDLVELPAAQYALRMPRELSGGQQQRVGFARALAGRPRIVLMDEPFGALDPITRDALGQAYLKLHAKLGLTTIMVTHDLQEALLLADRIGVMHEGRLAALGKPKDLVANGGDPYVEELIAAPRRQAARIVEKFGDGA